MIFLRSNKSRNAHKGKNARFFSPHSLTRSLHTMHIQKKNKTESKIYQRSHIQNRTEKNEYAHRTSATNRNLKLQCLAIFVCVSANSYLCMSVCVCTHLTEKKKHCICDKNVQRKKYECTRKKKKN